MFKTISFTEQEYCLLQEALAALIKTGSCGKNGGSAHIAALQRKLVECPPIVQPIHPMAMSTDPAQRNKELLHNMKDSVR